MFGRLPLKLTHISMGDKPLFLVKKRLLFACFCLSISLLSPQCVVVVVVVVVVKSEQLQKLCVWSGGVKSTETMLYEHS